VRGRRSSFAPTQRFARCGPVALIKQPPPPPPPKPPEKLPEPPKVKEEVKIDQPKDEPKPDEPKAADDKRIVLIYPEGHLTQVGEHKRIRAGVCHMQETSQWPVLLVATSLGLRWQEQDRQVSRARCDRVSRSNSTGSWQR
jgi:hypothetical protein